MTEEEQNSFKSIMTQVNCVYVYQNGSDYFKSSFHWGRKTRIFSRNHWEENCFFFQLSVSDIQNTPIRNHKLLFRHPL